MERLLGGDLSQILGRAEATVLALGAALLEPDVLVQFAAVTALLLLAQLAGQRIEAALEPRVRAIHGRPRLLRFLALMLRRTRWITAALLLAAAALWMRETKLADGGPLVWTAATLVAAWVAISVASRLIRNRPLGRLVAWLAWVYVALTIVGALDEVAAALDALALRVGAVRISAYRVLQAIVVVCGLLWLAAIAGRLAERRIAANADLTPSLKVLLGKLAKIVLTILAGAVALAALGIDLTALTVFSGALGVGIGFGLQRVVSNFVSGIIILADKSIKPGDTISLQDGQTFGWVRSLRARFVSVLTRDGREYLIPNEDFITQRVENWSYTDTLIRVDVDIRAGYDCDPHAVRRLAVEAARGVERVVERPQPVCHLTEFGENSLHFLLRFWITDPQNGMTNVRGAVLLACWDAFREAGIPIPFPQREIVVKAPVELRRADES